MIDGSFVDLPILTIDPCWEIVIVNWPFLWNVTLIVVAHRTKWVPPWTPWFVDTDRSPRVFHVLVTLDPAELFAAIGDRPALPREQKKRVEDYGHVFLDSVMTNLGR